MRNLILGAAALGLSAPVGATTYFASVSGVVTSQFNTDFTAPGATSPIKVGDIITATFMYNSGATGAEMLARSFGMFGANQATFKLDGYTWTSRGDFLGHEAPPQFADGSDPLANYYSTMDDAPGGGDLRVKGYAFEIGEFGYDLYTGLGFKGMFDQNSLVIKVDGVQTFGPGTQSGELYSKVAFQEDAPVPEPATWAMMISGFGLAGVTFRRVRRRPAPATLNSSAV